jgi:hypothetical protein
MTTVCFYAQFTESKVGKNSLTVTWDVERITRANGTRSALVTGGANSITIGRRGLYGYVLADADLLTYDYIATAITADSTVDTQEVPALWTFWALSWHDVATSILTTVGSIGKFLVDQLSSGLTATVAISAAEASSVASGNLAITAYETWKSQTVTSTSMLDLSAATKLWLAVKTSTGDADAASIIFLEKTAGLTVLLGAAYGTPTDGGLTVAGSVGAWEITPTVQEAATALLTGLDTRYVAEIKALVGGDTYIIWSGYADTGTGVVRALS